MEKKTSLHSFYTIKGTTVAALPTESRETFCNYWQLRRHGVKWEVLCLQVLCLAHLGQVEEMLDVLRSCVPHSTRVQGVIVFPEVVGPIATVITYR